MRKFWQAVVIIVCAVVVTLIATWHPKPKPVQRTMTPEEANRKLEEIAKRLENHGPNSLKASDDLYDQLQKEKLIGAKPAATVPAATAEGAANTGGEVAAPIIEGVPAAVHREPVSAPEPEPAPVVQAAPPVGSREQFTALIAKAGFRPQTNVPGYLPYFEAYASNEDEAGIPGKLRIVYVLTDDKRTLYFLAIVRQLRQGELPSLNMDDPFHQADDDSMAKDVIAKLQGANPAFKSSKFGVRTLPSGMEGDAVLMVPTVVLGAGFQNLSANPEVVKAAVAELTLVLRGTVGVWK
jgi:hypothetical protein